MNKAVIKTMVGLCVMIALLVMALSSSSAIQQQLFAACGILIVPFLSQGGFVRKTQPIREAAAKAELQNVQFDKSSKRETASIS